MSVALSGLLVAAGCGSGDNDEADDGGTTTSEAQAAGGKIPAGKGAHGVTEDTIEVGLWTFGTEQGNATLGAAGGNESTFSQGTNIVKAAQAVVDHVNADGGIAGRRVVARIIGVDVAKLTTAAGRSQEAQRACSYWTEDNKVFAFDMISSTDKEGLGCALDSGTITMSDTGIQANAVLSEAMFKKYRKVWYSPNFMLAERRERNLVEELVRAGFFTPDAKVGILYHDKEGPRDGVEKGLVPALAKHKIEPVAKIAYPDGVEAPWDNYILQLQQKGVTHVLFAESEMAYWPALYAMRTAETQKYRPKWGLASDQNPPVLALFKAPREQMANATGMAWNHIAMDEFDSPNSQACHKIATDAGQQGVGQYCEFLFFLKHVLDNASEVSLSGFEAALAKVGTGYEGVAAIEGETSFSTKKHDGPSKYRGFAFDPQCTPEGAKCWKYTTPLTPMKP